MLDNALQKGVDLYIEHRLGEECERCVEGAKDYNCI